MRCLINTDDSFAPLEIVFQRFTPDEKIKNDYHNRTFFLNSYNIDNIENPKLIDALWKKSFAISQRYKHENEVVNLIVFNDTECNKLRLSDSEKASVIMHELGHILNRYSLCDKYPSLEECIIKEVKYDKQNYKKTRKIDEFYADYFAIKYGFRADLISCLDKSINCTDYASLHTDFKERLICINNNDKKLEGIIKK